MTVKHIYLFAVHFEKQINHHLSITSEWFIIIVQSLNTFEIRPRNVIVCQNLVLNSFYLPSLNNRQVLIQHFSILIDPLLSIFKQRSANRKKTKG